jgi:hypothetical protein
VKPSWRDTFAIGQKLLREGLPPLAISDPLKITVERLRDIQEAC